VGKIKFGGDPGEKLLGREKVGRDYAVLKIPLKRPSLTLRQIDPPAWHS